MVDSETDNPYVKIRVIALKCVLVCKIPDISFILDPF